MDESDIHTRFHYRIDAGPDKMSARHTPHERDVEIFGGIRKKGRNVRVLSLFFMLRRSYEMCAKKVLIIALYVVPGYLR